MKKIILLVGLALISCKKEDTQKAVELSVKVDFSPAWINSHLEDGEKVVLTVDASRVFLGTDQTIFTFDLVFNNCQHQKQTFTTWRQEKEIFVNYVLTTERDTLETGVFKMSEKGETINY
jgi:hypothetical protein